RLVLVGAVAALAALEGGGVEVAIHFAIARSELAEVRALLLLVYRDPDVRPNLVASIERDELPLLSVNLRAIFGQGARAHADAHAVRAALARAHTRAGATLLRQVLRNFLDHVRVADVFPILHDAQ